MPITYWTALIGSPRAAGFPGTFAGFFSKDAIIEAVHASHHSRGPASPMSRCWLGVFVTALLFLPPVLPGVSATAKGAWTTIRGTTCHESPWVVTLPLVLLAVPSLVSAAGHRAAAVRRMVRRRHLHRPAHDTLAHLGEATGRPASSPRPARAAVLVRHGRRADGLVRLSRNAPASAGRAAPLRAINKVLERKYGFDQFNDFFFAGGARLHRPRPVEARATSRLIDGHGERPHAGSAGSRRGCGTCRRGTSTTTPSP
jgi:NADH-quinone oxidoreductase subunit L